MQRSRILVVDDHRALGQALVARLGVQARRFAETFTWERAAEETATHLYRVLASRRPLP